jgi:filamentous hemagglutinin
MIQSNRTSQATVRRMLARVAIILVIMALAYVFRDRDAPLAPRDVGPSSDHRTAARPIPDDSVALDRPTTTVEDSKPSNETTGGDEKQQAENDATEETRAEAPSKEPPTAKDPPAKKPAAPAAKPDVKKPQTEKPSEKSEEKESESADVIIRNVTIRNQSDRVVYRGDINLTPTLDRIKKGVRNEHRNDGSTFQNREKRLPKREDGYYKEYVHPTKGVSGPGPQRVILGKEGEIYYTSDHYGSFKRIK